jgi:hypothetical protein
MKLLTIQFSCPIFDFTCPGMKMAIFWVVVPCGEVMMEAEGISEMSVYFYQTTQRYNPEESHLHTRCCENLKSYSPVRFVASVPNHSMYFS